MKTILDKEQSEHLQRLGCKFSNNIAIQDDNKDYYIRIGLEDLLNEEILPNKISYNYDDCFLMMIRDVYGNYSVGYAFETFDGPIFCNGCEFGGELIDSLYQLVCWYYGEYLKK